MKEATINYTNGEVTIVWKPHVCIHSTICWRSPGGLPEVFNPTLKKWINPNGASTEKIIEQVNKCPSGALSYFMNSEDQEGNETTAESIVEVTENGPLLVYGNITVKHKDGSVTQKKSHSFLQVRRKRQ